MLKDTKAFRLLLQYIRHIAQEGVIDDDLLAARDFCRIENICLGALTATDKELEDWIQALNNHEQRTEKERVGTCQKN